MIMFIQYFHKSEKLSYAMPNCHFHFYSEAESYSIAPGRARSTSRTRSRERRSRQSLVDERPSVVEGQELPEYIMKELNPGLDGQSLKPLLPPGWVTHLEASMNRFHHIKKNAPVEEFHK